MLVSTSLGEIKSKKKLSNLVKKENYILNDIKNVKSLKEWFNIPEYIDDEYAKFIVLNFYKNGIKHLKYMIDVYPNYSESQYVEYLSFKSVNPKDVASKEYFIAKFGENYVNFYNKDKKNRSSRLLPYNLQYWLNLGYSKAESVEKIKEYKQNKVTTLGGFVKRHGKDKGLIEYNKWISKCSMNTEKLIAKHGESKAKEMNKSKGITLEKMISKYGNKEGEQRYKKWKNSIGLTFAQLISKHGIEEAERIISSRTQNVENYIKRYGEIDGIKRYTEYVNKKTKKNNSNYSSKEATILFESILKELELSITSKYSSDKNNEIAIYDKELKRCYFYDLFIKSKDIKVIIEYHGIKYHPKSVNDNPDEFILLVNKEDVREKYQYDRRKVELAKSYGYKVLEVWSDENNKKEKIKQFLNENKIY